VPATKSGQNKLTSSLGYPDLVAGTISLARWQKFVAATGHETASQETSRHFGHPEARQQPAGYFGGADFARDRRAAEGTSAVPPVPIYRAAAAPSIDGVLDDACWRDAVPVRANWFTRAPAAARGVPARERSRPRRVLHLLRRRHADVGSASRRRQSLQHVAGRNPRPADDFENGIARRADGSLAMAGKTLSLLAVSLDGHGNQAAYRSSAAWLPPRMFHFSVDLWPKFVLVADSPNLRNR